MSLFQRSVRLQKAIADLGVCSRRRAEILIQEGKVRVNGKVITQMGVKVDPRSDEIQVVGKMVGAQKQEKVYYLFYKPKNTVSTLSDPEGRPCLTDHVKYLKTRVYPIGRLDFESEGLMILTNDGALTQKITHPSSGIHKTYDVTVDQAVTQEKLQCLKEGAVVEGKKVVPVSCEWSALRYPEGRRPEGSRFLKFVLQDGRKREIRVICENNGFKVTRLVRVAIGKIELRNLRSGELKQVDSQTILPLF